METDTKFGILEMPISSWKFKKKSFPMKVINGITQRASRLNKLRNSRTLYGNTGGVSQEEIRAGVDKC